MKTLLITILLGIAACCPAQTNASKKSAKKSAVKPPPPSQAWLQAAAVTNFDARCAIDFDWKAATNGIAKSEAKLDGIRQRLEVAEQRHSLQWAAGQTRTGTSPEIVQLQAEQSAEFRASAAFRLKKLEAEEQIRRLNPKLKSAR